MNRVISHYVVFSYDVVSYLFHPRVTLSDVLTFTLSLLEFSSCLVYIFILFFCTWMLILLCTTLPSSSRQQLPHTVQELALLVYCAKPHTYTYSKFIAMILWRWKYLTLTTLGGGGGGGKLLSLCTDLHLCAKRLNTNLFSILFSIHTEKHYTTLADNDYLCVFMCTL